MVVELCRYPVSRCRHRWPSRRVGIMQSPGSRRLGSSRRLRAPEAAAEVAAAGAARGAGPACGRPCLHRHSLPSPGKAAAWAPCHPSAPIQLPTLMRYARSSPLPRAFSWQSFSACGSWSMMVLLLYTLILPIECVCHWIKQSKLEHVGDV